ncbi:MAG: phospho-sugar mutase [Acidimicrobiia bacterium]|nr:phospho-sugar mutase [Acidimicrobiia bacterium]
MVENLYQRALSWSESDPEDRHRDFIRLAVEREDVATLEDLFGDFLTFGTAGIRGEVGPGPNRMNRAVVIRTTRGLADHLLTQHGETDRPVVVGFDARPTSAQFAEDTVGVLAAAGLPVIYFPEVTPTPLVAFAAKSLSALAAVVITASHNPKGDNGYKVYGKNAAQIIPPDDTDIAQSIDRLGATDQIPRVENAFSNPHPLVTTAPADILDRYWQEVSQSRPEAAPSDLRIVYTPLHGVGGEVLETVFARAGHSGLIPVSAQFDPDGSFPTLDFPNPEDPGALDLALQTAQRDGADLILANDPDADRLAVVVPAGGGEWRPLSGNEVGALLGDYLLRHYQGDGTPIVVSSIVSSPVLARIARLYGARHEMTLTGFKWIVSAGLALESEGNGEFIFGYEEALGYMIGQTVLDKDGISAALVFADLSAGLSRRGSSILKRLVEIWDVSGLWVSTQRSIVRRGVEGAGLIQEAVAALAANPPRQVAGIAVEEITDYREGEQNRPPWLGAQDLVELSLGEKGRVLVRPSGTEPKLKIYVDLRGECGNDAFAAHDALDSEAQYVAAELEAGLYI